MNDSKFLSHYNKYRQPLMNFAYNFTKDVNESEELVQETFLRAYKARNNFKEGTNFKSWSFTILRNLFISKYNKAKRRKTVSKPVEELAFAFDKKVHATNKGTMNLNLEIINQCIENLSYKSKMPFLMHVEGFQYDEIADTMNIPLGTVKSRINFARKKLKSALTSKGLAA